MSGTTDDKLPGEAQALAKVEALMRPQRRVEEGEEADKDEMRLDTAEVQRKFRDLRRLLPGLPGHVYSISDFIGDYLNSNERSREIVVEAIPMQITLALYDLSVSESYGKRLTTRAAGLPPEMYEVYQEILVPKILPLIFTQEQVAAMLPMFG